MNRRVAASLVGVFAIGALLGAVVAAAASDSTADVVAGPTAEDCAEAQAVVDTGNENIAAITAVESTQDASFFAAILSEQRAITYALDAAPDCFSLAERAASAGFLDGIRALAVAAPFGDGAPVTPVESPTEPAPEPAPDTPEPPTSDVGE